MRVRLAPLWRVVVAAGCVTMAGRRRLLPLLDEEELELLLDDEEELEPLEEEELELLEEEEELELLEEAGGLELPPPHAQRQRQRTVDASRARVATDMILTECPHLFCDKAMETDPVRGPFTGY